MADTKKIILKKVTASIGKIFALVRGAMVEVGPDAEEVNNYENSGADASVTVIVDGEAISLKDQPEIDTSELVENPIKPYLSPDEPFDP